MKSYYYQENCSRLNVSPSSKFTTSSDIIGKMPVSHENEGFAIMYLHYEASHKGDRKTQNLSSIGITPTEVTTTLSFFFSAGNCREVLKRTLGVPSV